MALEAAQGMLTQLSPSLGPALMISMGYIDLGKWVAAVDGGIRFGFELVSVALLFNCMAILCQYLSTCIGTATGKNLAEICKEEYSRTSCVILGAQAELSMIISDITMILGIAHGLGLLFGMEPFMCICCATINIVLVPSYLSSLDDCKVQAICIGVAAFTLVLFVFGILLSQPEVPLVTGGIFPKLSGESAYSIMALLGANIMAHNFYIHSSIMKKQKRQANVATSAVIHDHLFSILFIFTGIFMANYVLMNSAAAVFGSMDGVFSYEDISILMEQIFRNPIAPFAFLMVLFFSSQITTLIKSTSGLMILQHFFNLKLSSVQYSVIKTVCIIPVLYYAKNSNPEGIYSLLLYCQVVLAVLLPSSVIPLFRVASSGFVMHTYKISWHVEILALIAFLLAFSSNIFLSLDMLFGNFEISAVIPYIILLVLSCASIAFTLHLAVTPLKSASDRSDVHTWTSKNRNKMSELPETDVLHGNLDAVKNNSIQESSTNDTFEKSSESQPENSMQELNSDILEATVDSDHESHHSTYSSSLTLACTSPKSQPEEAKSIFDEIEPFDSLINKAPSALAEFERIESINSNVKINDGYAGKEHIESFKGFPLSISEIPESFSDARSRGSESLDAYNGSQSLTKLPGLGRATRRQLAAILDEFWGNLFDFHGKLTKEASANRLDVLLGISTNISDGIGYQASKKDTDPFNSSKQTKTIPSMESSPYGPWAQSTQLPNPNAQNSSERLYSSLHMPQYSENRDYQPATIHGYQLASYLRELNAARSTSTINAPSSIPNLREQVLYARAQNELNAKLQNPGMPRVSRLHAEAPSFEPSFNEFRESSVSSTNAKKYHSSPDISALIALGRNAYLNEANRNIPIGPQSSGVQPNPSSQYLNSIARPGVPLGFDHISPPKYRDILSPNQDTISLWAKQPFEQLFGVAGSNGLRGDSDRVIKRPAKETHNYAEAGAKLLQSLRICIIKLLKLEGSDWLFNQSSGSDEELIDRVAASEKYLNKGGNSDIGQFGSYQRSEDANSFQAIPNCGYGCIWQAAVVVSFGVWCIRHILELSLVESRPELWGKYTFVLNRLQGIIEPAFFKPRQPLSPCSCLETSTEDANTFNASLQLGLKNKSMTNANSILDIIKDVETAVSGRKGRTGTAAGDIAFPKGKENLASVLKRYKRRLSSKSN